MTTGGMDDNYQRVTEGLRTLTAVLAPYVAQELRAELGGEWWSRGVLGVLHENQRRDLPAAGNDGELVAKLDGARCLRLMDVQWNDLFRHKLSREHRTWIKELITTRNKWAHPELLGMADEDAWRALDTMTRLVEQIDAEATERLRALARNVRYGTEGPSTAAAGAAGERRGGDGAARPVGGRRAHGRCPPRTEALEGGREAASRRLGRPLPAGGVRGGSLAGGAGPRGSRVPGSGGVLRPHVSHRRHARADDAGAAANCPARGRTGHPAQDGLRWREDALAARPVSPVAGTRCVRQVAGGR